MIESITRTQPRRMPSEVKEWIIQTLKTDYGWDPNGGTNYHRAFGLAGVVRDLLAEAATLPRFAYCSDVILFKRSTKDVTKTLFGKKEPVKPRHEVFISRGLSVRLTPEFKFMCFKVELRSKHLQNIENKNGKISRVIPGDLMAAISYRDRVTAALQGPNPLSALDEPLLLPHILK